MKKQVIIALFSTLVQIASAAPGGWDNHHERNYHQPRGHANGHNHRPVRPMPPVICPPAPVVQHRAPLPMSNRDFAGLRAAISNAPFESSKLTIFRQALAYNFFTTAQVMDLMNLFYFDNSRLEVAKIAYDKTVDPQRYYLVNSAFTFSSSSRELGEYLAMR